MEATEGEIEVSYEETVSEERASAWTSADTFALTAITVAAGVLRLVRLDDPKVLVFDETYYAKDACWYVTSSPALCST